MTSCVLRPPRDRNYPLIDDYATYGFLGSKVPEPIETGRREWSQDDASTPTAVAATTAKPTTIWRIPIVVAGGTGLRRIQTIWTTANTATATDLTEDSGSERKAVVYRE